MITQRRHRTGAARERGTALFLAIILVTVLAILSAAFFSLTSSAHSEQRRLREDVKALYVAETGLNDAFVDLNMGGPGAPPPPTWTIGSEAAPVAFGGAGYWVDAENLGSRVYALRATGVEGTSRTRIELVVREIPDGFFRYAAFGEEGVQLSPESFIDSYDSELGSYASQFDSSAGYANEQGHVGSNHDIVLRTNTEIHGNASPGPGHAVIEAGPNGYVSGSTEPAEELVDMPPIDVPVIPASPPVTVNGGTYTIPPGDTHLSGLNIRKGKVVIQGPATVVLDSFLLRSGTELEIDATNGPVDLYGTGDFQLSSNSTLTTSSQRPHDFGIWLTSNNVDGRPPDSVEFSSNSEYYGTIYAPNSEIEIDATFDLYGSVMARIVSFGANSAIHFDESLLFDDSTPPEYESVSWRPVAEQ